MDPSPNTINILDWMTSANPLQYSLKRLEQDDIDLIERGDSNLDLSKYFHYAFQEVKGTWDSEQNQVRAYGHVIVPAGKYLIGNALGFALVQPCYTHLEMEGTMVCDNTGDSDTRPVLIVGEADKYNPGVSLRLRVRRQGER